MCLPTLEESAGTQDFAIFVNMLAGGLVEIFEDFRCLKTAKK